MLAFPLFCILTVLTLQTNAAGEDIDYESLLNILSYERNEELKMFQSWSKSQWFNHPDILARYSLLNMGNPESNSSRLVLKHSQGKYQDLLNNCNGDLLYTLFSLKKMWAMQMIDAAGKMRSGILQGATNWPGSFDGCQEVVAPPPKTFRLIASPEGFRGRYCTLTVNLQMPNNPKTVLPLKFGICVPSSCKEIELREDNEAFYNFTKKIPFIKNLVSKLPKISSVVCSPQPDEVKYNTGTICCIVLIAVTCSIVGIATLCDIYLKYSKGDYSAKFANSPPINNQEINKDVEEVPVNIQNASPSEPLIEATKPLGEKFLQALMAFSALENATAILDTKTKEGQLNCLHGIRCLSICWVILGHTLFMGLSYWRNQLSVVKDVNTYSFQVIVQAPFSVDTFFLLSGFLVTYLFLKNTTKMTWSSWIYFYVHRFIRLTPVYMVLVFLYATLWNYFGDGPFWKYSDRDSNNCTKNWWWNLLYINNFLDVADLCVGWSWYLANDIQFYIISPLFLVPLKSSKYRRVSFAIIGVMLMVSWIITGVISSIHSFSAMFQDVTNSESESEALAGTLQQFNILYTKPWIRIGPYLIGALLAYSIIEAKRSNGRVHWSVVALGWCGAAFVNVVLVYGLYNSSLNGDVSAFYNTMSRSAWALSVAWVIFACTLDMGGVVNKILSMPIWFPLSRLTYCAYLVHPMIMYWYFMSQRDTIYYTHSSMGLHFLGFLVLSYGMAFVISLIYEAPVIKLEKLLRR